MMIAFGSGLILFSLVLAFIAGAFTSGKNAEQSVDTGAVMIPALIAIVIATIGMIVVSSGSKGLSAGDPITMEQR